MGIGAVSLGVNLPTALSLEQIEACLPVEIELVSRWQTGFGGQERIQCHEWSCYVCAFLVKSFPEQPAGHVPTDEPCST